jgi:hypothetical protein
MPSRKGVTSTDVTIDDRSTRLIRAFARDLHSRSSKVGMAFAIAGEMILMSPRGAVE